METKELDLGYQQGVSVIISATRGAGGLERLLESFLSNNSHYPFEIVVIDYDTGGEVQSIIEKYAARAFFVHLKSDQSSSYAASGNYAAQKAVYPHLLFIEEDLIFNADPLPGAVKKINDPAATGPKKFFSLDQLDPKALSGSTLFCRRADFDTAGGFSGLSGANPPQLYRELGRTGSANRDRLLSASRAPLGDLSHIFKPYDPALPVISIHIPKTAGTAFRAVLEEWFQDDLFMFYPDLSRPETRPFSGLLPGQCVHGHFNRRKGFGLEDYAGEKLPQKANIITMLRDPYKMIVSLFLYYKYQAPQEVLEKSVLVDQRPRDFKPFFNRFLESEHYLFSYLLSAPSLTDGDIDHYIANYTFIGIQEELEKSVLLLSRILGRKPLQPLQKNLSDYSKDHIPDRQAQAREVFKAEYRLYDRVKEIIASVKTP